VNTAVEKVEIVGIAEMHISTDPDTTLITYALGSCLGISIYDPVARVGGLLHVMLPESSINPERAVINPCRFVDTGVPRLFHASYDAGARKERLEIKVAGGATAHPDPSADSFQIGKRNFLMLRRLLWRNGVLIKAHDIGGQGSRTMLLEIATGRVRIRSQGNEFII
jgi:chemotaxis protein CheD